MARKAVGSIPPVPDPPPHPEWRLVRRRLQGGSYGVPREEEHEEEVQTLAAMASSQNPVSLPAHPFERHRLFQPFFCTWQQWESERENKKGTNLLRKTKDDPDAVKKKSSESIRSVAGRYVLTNKQTLPRSLNSRFSSFCLPLCLCLYNVSFPPLPLFLFLSLLFLILNRTQIATSARPSVSGRRILAADCTNLFCFCFLSCALSCVEFPP